jgi:peptidoglycan/LPS O-acetylase OafA/YrhL
MYSKWAPNAYFSKVFLVFFQSIGCFLLLPKFDSIKKATPVIVKVFTHISLISYSMYLLNLAIVAEVLTANFPPAGKLSAWCLYGVYWVMVILLSTLLYKYYEKPMMDLRDKWKSPDKILSRMQNK